jgi:hypothetical protein
MAAVLRAVFAFIVTFAVGGLVASLLGVPQHWWVPAGFATGTIVATFAWRAAKRR